MQSPTKPETYLVENALSPKVDKNQNQSISNTSGESASPSMDAALSPVTPQKRSATSSPEDEVTSKRSRRCAKSK